ncbi:LOW QUALITY PROTEIN: uncharacterized protein ACOB6Z_016762 [Ctenodactylus gundi]
MAPYCIRKYKESDRKPVLQLFAQGMYEHVPATFRHMLRLPKTLLVIFGVPFSLLLISGSWLLAIMSSFTLLLFLWYLASYPWKNYLNTSLCTDMADISKSYLSTRGSCFWVAESGGGAVVGTVGALPVKSPPLGKKQLELFHLSVDRKHRGEGIAKALVRTVVLFVQEQGYNEVVMITGIVQLGALALYHGMSFQKTGQFFLNTIWRLAAEPKDKAGTQPELSFRPGPEVRGSLRDGQRLLRALSAESAQRGQGPGVAAIGPRRARVPLPGGPGGRELRGSERPAGRRAILPLVRRTSGLGLLQKALSAASRRFPMAPYHIRKYQESDREIVLDLFARGMEEHIPATFRHIVTLPRTLLLVLGVSLCVLLVSGSWLLGLMSCFTVLAFLRLLVRRPWKQYVDTCFQTDMADISKSYLSACGSCFWVADSGGKAVGTVGALPVESPPSGKKQLELFHLSVAMEHRGQGIGKALVRTVLQFARDQGYSEVVIETTILHRSALALYQRMGFQRTGQYFPSTIWRILAVPDPDPRLRKTRGSESANQEAGFRKEGGDWAPQPEVEDVGAQGEICRACPGRGELSSRVGGVGRHGKLSWRSLGVLSRPRPAPGTQRGEEKVSVSASRSIVLGGDKKMTGSKPPWSAPVAQPAGGGGGSVVPEFSLGDRPKPSV